jgi:hypothetical protein
MGEANERAANTRLLVNAGHSPLKAAEIALDVERGDSYAIAWIKHSRVTLSHMGEK